jgi:hypothetical protein
MYSTRTPNSNIRFFFCIIDCFAYSPYEFKKPGIHTPVFKSAVDALNVFDLFIEVYKNLKYLFLNIILRRPYAREPENETFNLQGAFGGKRNLSIYAKQHAYDEIPIRAVKGTDEEALVDEGTIPASLLPGLKRPVFPDDDLASSKEDLGHELKPMKLEREYSNTYGERI